jgi:hypothetical protein
MPQQHFYYPNPQNGYPVRPNMGSSLADVNNQIKQQKGMMPGSNPGGLRDQGIPPQNVQQI